MAKKKKTAPQKACRKCGEMMHARKSVCDKCGTVQQTGNGRTAAKKKSAARKPTGKKPAQRVDLGAVESAADFISSMGGVAKAKQAISAAEELAKKMS